MKNAYLTSHFPIISILLFSLSLSIYFEALIIEYLRMIGLLEGMIEFISEEGIHLIFLFILWLIFFMFFAALKLIANTVNELSLLFFSKDDEGIHLRSVKSGSWFFLIGGIVSVLVSFNLFILLGVFIFSSFTYFIYFLFKVSHTVSILALIGLIFFHLLFWTVFLFTIAFMLLRLYNSIMASLPI